MPTQPMDIQEIISGPNFMQSRGQIFNLAQSSTFSPSSTGTGLQNIFLDPGYYVQVPSSRSECQFQQPLQERASLDKVYYQASDPRKERQDELSFEIKVELPGKKACRVKVKPSDTLLEVRIQVINKLPPGEIDFHLLYDGLILLSDLKCEVFKDSTLEAALTAKGGGRQAKNSSRKTKLRK